MTGPGTRSSCVRVMLLHCRAELLAGNLSAMIRVPKHTMLTKATDRGGDGGGGKGGGGGGGRASIVGGITNRLRAGGAGGASASASGGDVPPALLTSVSASGHQLGSSLASHCFFANCLYM